MGHIDVKIRSLELSDKLRLAELMNNKKIWDNIRDYIPFPYSVSDAEFFINLSQNDNSLENFAIDYNGEFCGVIGLVLQSDIYKLTAEIGYWIGEPYWGKGIASEAVRLITRYGFENLDLVRIHTGVFDYNTGSMKVLEKNGYKKDGVFKKAILKNGKILDEHRYFILKEDYNIG